MKEISVEGVILPNESLSNIQLIAAARKLMIPEFRGVYLRDELPKRSKVKRSFLKVKECGILNLDDSSGPGTHWVAWMYSRGRKIYFDSYGLPPPNELLKYLRDDVYYNSERIQPDDQVFCGHLCLYVLKKVMNDGVNFQEVINALH